MASQARKSFVSDVLKKAGHMEKKAVHEQLDTLLNKLRELELDVHQLAEDKYVNFKPTLEEAEHLSDKVQLVQIDLQSVEQKISTEIKDQVGVSTGDFQSLNQKLSDARIKLSALDYLSDIHDLLNKTSEEVENQKYSEAALALFQLEKLFQKPLSSNDDKISILANMEVELKVQRESLKHALSDSWSQAVKWNIEGDSPAKANDVLTNVTEVSLTVRNVGREALTLKETVEGLYMTDRLALHSKMKTFAKRLKDYMLPFVLEKPSLKMDVETVNNCQTLRMSLGKTIDDSPDSCPDEVQYKSVFTNLLTLLEHLHSLVLHVEYGKEDSTNQSTASCNSTINQSSVNESDNDSKTTVKASAAGSLGVGTLMQLLGREVAPGLLDEICRTVLARAVPTSAKDLEGFHEVVTCTELMQEKFVKLGFILPENRVLLDYVDNVNALFANKKCQAILVQARDLMTSSLHDSVPVTEDKPVGHWPPLVHGGLKKTRKAEDIGDHLSDGTLRLPKCRISESIQNLVQCAYETLKEATESSQECAVQMVYAVHGMFETFLYVMPTHHSQSMETFPQVAALHHNNCMYIAHHLLSLGHQFTNEHIKPTFVDLVNPIRRTGLETFIQQIQRQKSLLKDSLEGAKGFANVEETENHERCERAIKQVILQLEHLQKIWKPVLAINVYKKTMGQLIRHVVSQATDCITVLEDISEEAGHVLVSLMKPLEETCGQLLTSPGEVAQAELLRHVEGWGRLEELKLLLAASLADIADRWAEGKGPLAVVFSPKEVKQMIRAVFQNSDRRASVLANIK